MSPNVHPTHQQLHLYCSSPPVDIKVEMGDGPATPSAGFSGYETVTRVRRKAMTAFVGVQPFQQDVPILLDGLPNRDVEPQLRRILKLGGAAIFTATGPIYYSGERFIFGDEPEFGDTLRDQDGTLLKVALTLKLMEYVSPNQAGRRVKAGNQRGRPEKTGGTAFPGTSYTTKKGDTLVDIAKNLYGDWEEWKAIAKKNGLTDPNKPLKPGTKLQLP